MRVLLCTEWGEPDKLTIGNILTPSISPSQVRIGIHACGLNFADTLMIQGLYQEKPPFLFSPRHGLKQRGKVLEVGAAVTHVPLATAWPSFAATAAWRKRQPWRPAPCCRFRRRWIM
ncbi:MAG: hypothetical protein R2911_21075 [Caldilineaceae bacterium]